MVDRLASLRIPQGVKYFSPDFSSDPRNLTQALQIKYCAQCKFELVRYKEADEFDRITGEQLYWGVLACKYWIEASDDQPEYPALGTTRATSKHDAWYLNEATYNIYFGNRPVYAPPY